MCYSFISGSSRFHHRLMDRFGETADEDYGRDTTVVFVFCWNFRSVYLYKMEIQVDSFILDGSFYSLYPAQCLQAGNPCSDTDAGTSKSVVYTACDSVYVFVFIAWMCLSDSCGTDLEV